VIVPPATGNGPEHRLPIYESVESDWFRRGRPAATAATAATDRNGTDRNGADPNGSGRNGTDWPGVDRARLDRAAAAASPEPASWTSPADAGWQAAEVAYSPVTAGTTVAGLPKRVPKANLVPGAAGPSPLSHTLPPVRTAAQTRDRLASFQQGIRKARTAEPDEEPTGRRPNREENP
jgi:hypothetical protein